MPLAVDIAGVQIGNSSPIRIMGIINLSPESFYSKSVYTRPMEVLQQAREMLEEGCDFLDIGGRSTAPGVTSISIQEEKERVLPILKTLVKECPVPISIDTQYAEVAHRALELGAQIVNDVSGLRTDPQLLSIVKEFDCPLIVMASKKVPGDCLTMDEILNALKWAIHQTIQAEINPTNLIIDPGIGRWVAHKTYEYNIKIINELKQLQTLRKPILVGISRKSFIGDILQLPDPADRLIGTLAATAIAVYNGAHIIRTHDVKETREAIGVAESFRKLL
ncbi:MAG: dihydropteroate synthase [Candidatus Helarchaeota archaeon]